MVDLPTIPERNVTSPTPQSAVTPGVIQQQANAMAGALGKMSDAMMDISTEQAKTQAAEDLQNQRVTRGPDGQVVVENKATAPLLFGDAHRAYEHAVEAGTIAQHGNLVSKDLNDLHLKFQADPQGFQQAAEAFRAKYLGEVGGGRIGQGIARQIDQLATQHYNSIADTTAKADLSRQGSAIKASQESAYNDVMTLMRGGASMDDPAVQTKIQQWQQANTARASNPLFGYSQEQAHLDQQEFLSEATANRFLYDVNKTYQDKGEGGGYAGAMQRAEGILTDPKYALSPKLREQYYHRATADIRANEALRKQDVAQARAAFQELSMASAAGARIDSSQVEQVAEAFRASGDPGGAARVYASFARKPLNDAFGQQPLAQQNQQLSAMRGLRGAMTAQQFFMSKGYTPEQAAGIVGNLIHESGMDPNAVGDNGTSLGIAQFHKERRAALEAFAKERGKPASDFQTQLEFVEHELQTTEGKTRAKLLAAKTPEQAAHAFIDYERPQGWTPENPAGGMGYASRVKQARAMFDRRPADGSLGPAGSAWLETNRASSVSSTADKTWSTIMDDYKKQGTLPSQEKVNEIVRAAHLSGNVNLLEQIGADTQRMDFARTSAQQPLAVQANTNAQLDVAGATGNLTPGAAAVQSDLERRFKAITTGLEQNPIATTAQNFPDKVKMPGPLDFSSPDKLAAGLKARSTITQFARENWQTGQLSVLDRADVQQIQSALQGPQGGVVLQTLVGAVNKDELRKLFDDKDVVASVTGMQSSKDPAKMTAAMGVVDKMWRDNPADAEDTFKKDSITKLQAWQGLQGVYTPAELAEILNKADDPHTATSRNKLREDAEKETTNITPGDIAYKLGSSWGIPLISSVANVVTGATPNVPFNAVAAGGMVAEYRATYASLRAYGVDATKASELAVKRLQSTWGASATAGNQLMKNPPERFYPTVNGTHDWMQKDLQTWVETKIGPRYAPQPRTLETGFAGAGQTENWKVVGIVPDGRTEADIAAGRPPAYQIAIQMADGTRALVGDGARIRFDPKEHVEHTAADLKDKMRFAPAKAGDEPMSVDAIAGVAPRGGF